MVTFSSVPQVQLRLPQGSLHSFLAMAPHGPLQPRAPWGDTARIGMFLIYLRRELRRRKKAALVISMGLALGIALVITVNSVSAGMTQAQGKVLQSLYGLG